MLQNPNILGYLETRLPQREIPAPAAQHLSLASPLPALPRGLSHAALPEHPLALSWLRGLEPGLAVPSICQRLGGGSAELSGTVIGCETTTCQLTFLLRLPWRLARAELEMNKLSAPVLFGGMLSRHLGFLFGSVVFMLMNQLSRAPKREGKKCHFGSSCMEKYSTSLLQLESDLWESAWGGRQGWRHGCLPPPRPRRLSPLPPSPAPLRPARAFFWLQHSACGDLLNPPLAGEAQKAHTCSSSRITWMRPSQAALPLRRAGRAALDPGSS